MGETTAISWTDHTFNPWMGCTKVSPACDHCYAEALMKRTGKVQWGDDAVRVVTSDGYWRNPIKWNRQAEAEGRRHRVFCASLADVFEDRPELVEPRRRLLDLIDATPMLDWQLLTKRPENVLRLIDFDPTVERFRRNVWIGATVEDEERTTRIYDLDDIPAPVRFLSCEPLLGPLTEGRLDLLNLLSGMDWVIVGGESGAGHRPLDVDTARTIRDACEFLEIPFFFKQHGGQYPTSGGHELDGQVWHQFPAPFAPVEADQ